MKLCRVCAVLSALALAVPLVHCERSEDTADGAAVVIEEPAPIERFSDADYAQHMMELQGKVPRGGFTVVIQRPFVVIGDEPPSVVKRRAQGTVKWSVDMLKREYFSKDPNEILDIWLFKDKSSYEEHALAILGDTPTTPFGYCSHTGKALVMNIETGGGTLVHEIVHAFVASNFPRCPAWFNEGLASLYEQCGDENGHIHGYTNWRLAGLQKAVKSGRVPSFRRLTHTTDYEFYNRDPGTNYAHARYLCYYLQQGGLLNRFYRKFVKNCETDPTGYETLREVLGGADMEAFKREWEAFVLRLRFP